MSNVKKAYVELVEFLQANEDKKVKSVLPDVIAMCSAKGAGGSATSFHRNDASEVTHIRCGYFKLWFPVGDNAEAGQMAFGEKAGSASGFAPMSKEGTNQWSKQQREYKAGKEALLDGMISGEVAQEDLQAELDKLEAARTRVEAPSVPGYATVEEALANS